MSIRIEDTFIKKFKTLTWKELKVAYDMNFVSINAFIDKALMAFEIDEHSDYEFELSSLSPNNTYQILEKVESIISSDKSQGEANLEKLACICFYWAYIYRSSIENLATVIDCLVGDFNYPDFAVELSVGQFGGVKHLKDFLQNCSHKELFRF